MRFDERDSVFAREEIFPGMKEYDSYYASHPELKEIDDKIRSLPGFGSNIPPEDKGMILSPIKMMYKIGSPDSVDGKPSDQIIKMSPEKAVLKIKAYAKLLGADLTGVSKMKEEFIYSHRGRIKYPDEKWGDEISNSHEFAISMGFGMDVDLIKTSPAHAESIGTMTAYLRSAVTSVILAEYIRSLGYPARAHHFRNYQVMLVPLAIEAGLGELGRCGFIISRKFGNCFRLSAVSTDLPLICDEPVDIGVQEFCEMCKLCADSCPTKAIPFGEKVESRGAVKWKINETKCITFWNAIGTDCGICIGSCPWSLKDSWYH